MWAAIDFTTLFMILIFWQMFGQNYKRKMTMRFSPFAIAIINIDGVIKHGTDERSPYPFTWAALREVLMLRPKGLILRINSPGGTVGASQELYSIINKIRENGTAVVALMEDVAASGGLYVAMAAGHIIAHPGTITGSIGVIMQSMEYSALLERWQLKVNTIKSGKHKDILSPARPMTEGDRELLNKTVMNVYEQFRDTVAERRHLTTEQVESFADGRIFSGKEALELQLVDEVGFFESAVEKIGGIAKFHPRQARFVLYHKRRGLFGGGASMRSILSGVNRIIPDADLNGLPLWLMPGK